MGRRRQQLTALTEPERTRLRKLADACASDAELLSELFQLMPDSPHKFAELLHTEFGVPVVAARTWLIEDGLRSGLRMEELADRCWRWIHSTFRGAEPARRVATLTEQDSALVDSRAREIDRLVTTPVARDRATFERALAEAYRLADLPPPRVLWVDGPGAGILMVMLCLYHGTERQRLAGILSERRFAQPPEHDLGAAMDSLCVALRDFMPVAYEADLPRYLTFDLLGGDASQRIVQELLGTALSRLDPVRSTRVSPGVVETLRGAFRQRAGLHKRLIRQGLIEAMWRAVGEPGEDNLLRDFLSREPGVWWYEMLGDAAVARTAADLGADPVFPLARRHKVAWALASGGFWSWLGYKVAICADGPTALNFEDGLPHAEDAPAIGYGDGFNVYAVEGHVVPDYVITHPETITHAAIEAERSAEVRRIMIDRYGRGRYLAETGATVIDMDMVDVVAGDASFGAMPRALMRDPGGRTWLVGTDGSTRRVYYMRVQDRTKTCAEAHEQLAGMNESNIIASS